MNRPELLVTPAHRAECVFGPGFYRIVFNDGGYRYVHSESEIREVKALLPTDTIRYIQRDGYCLDGDRSGDANTPDVVDGEQWLNMPQTEAMELVGLDTEADYARVYRQIEEAVGRRNDRESQTGVRASIVIKKRGAPVQDV